MTIEEFVRDYYVERQDSQSLKWDLLEERFGNPDLLPLWVADMDFKVSPAITQVLADRVQHGVYGYSYATSTYYEALSQWLSRHYNFEIEKDWLRFSTGVVQAIYHLIMPLLQKMMRFLSRRPSTILLPMRFVIVGASSSMLT